MKSWLLSLVAAALFSSLVLTFSPKGKGRQVCKLACGILCVLALAAPLKSLDVLSWLDKISEYQSSGETLTDEAKEESIEEQRTYIEQQFAAYILDEAERLKLSIENVEVELCREEENESWMPAACSISGAYDTTLSQWITEELGIEGEKQQWSD